MTPGKVIVKPVRNLLEFGLADRSEAGSSFGYWSGVQRAPWKERGWGPGAAPRWGLGAKPLENFGARRAILLHVLLHFCPWYICKLLSLFIK